ncbi:MAG: hypothetical protein ACPGR8_10805 [Limisphaerales bacterium]
MLERLRLPVLYMHIRRGDVLLPFYNKGRNANATSIANVARLYNRLVSESEFGSAVYSTNEVNATYLEQLAAALPGAVRFDTHPAIVNGCSKGNYDSFCIKCNILKLKHFEGVVSTQLGHH